MSATIETVGSNIVFTVNTTAIDAGNSSEFKRALTDVISDGVHVVLNLENVDFVDSAGLGAIVWVLKRLTACDGSLRLCGINPPVQTLFDLVRMHKLVRICGSLDEAVVKTVKRFEHV